MQSGTSCNDESYSVSPRTCPQWLQGGTLTCISKWNPGKIRPSPTSSSIPLLPSYCCSNEVATLLQCSNLSSMGQSFLRKCGRWKRGKGGWAERSIGRRAEGLGENERKGDGEKGGNAKRRGLSKGRRGILDRGGNAKWVGWWGRESWKPSKSEVSPRGKRGVQLQCRLWEARERGM